MKLATVLLFLAVATPFTGVAAEIPQGSHVMLRMMNSISTRTAVEGNVVYLQTATPITAEGRIIVPVGSYVQGVVSHAKRSGKVSGRAELGIRLETLTLPGGKTLKLSPRVNSVDANETGQRIQGGESTVKQSSDHGKDAAQVAITAGSGAMIGGIADRSWTGAGIGGGAGAAVGLATVLLTRGREVELRQGSALDVVFDRAVAVD